MSVGWPDLGGALLILGAFLLIAAGIVGLVIWDARRRKAQNVLLDATAAVARMWIALVIVGVLITGWRWLSGGDVWIPELPLSMAWPEMLPCAEPSPPTSFASATLVCAHVPTADATIAALSLGARLMLALGDVLALVLAALPAVVVAVICGLAIKGKPFAAPAARWLFIAAIVILVAGMGAELATGIGRQLAAFEVLPSPGEGEVTTTGTYQLTMPLWPMGAALALAALGFVFRQGSVLQRESEGLV